MFYLFYLRSEDVRNRIMVVVSKEHVSACYTEWRQAFIYLQSVDDSRSVHRLVACETASTSGTAGSYCIPEGIPNLSCWLRSHTLASPIPLPIWCQKVMEVSHVASHRVSQTSRLFTYTVKQQSLMLAIPGWYRRIQCGHGVSFWRYSCFSIHC